MGMTQGQVAQEIGVSYIFYNQLENFRASPLSKTTGDWKVSALKVAAFYGASPGDLWPSALREIKENSLVMYTDARELMPGQERLALPPDRQLDYHELQDTIDRALSVLYEREQKIVKMRLGLPPYDEKHTFAEISRFMGVTNTRVAELYERALSRIRTGPYHKQLSDWIFQEPYEIADEETP